MIYMHVAGRLVRDPEQKVSKNGKPYTQALLLAAAGEAEQLITLMAFDLETQTPLSGMKKGGGISVVGNASFRGYMDKDGQPQVGVTIMMNQMMAMVMTEGNGKAKAKAKQQQPRNTAKSHAAGPREFAPSSFDDNVSIMSL